ncbi:antitoxin [Brevibacterium litoralis]|uniref:antitoxin n=1 Tax=Brevibacterium litoralis TaxID=3138935 RepID=UPI0032F00267
MSVTSQAFSSSLPTTDLEFLDAYARRHHLTSRAATLRAAVRALREEEAEAEYVAAFEEWNDSDDSTLWDSTRADGLST